MTTAGKTPRVTDVHVIALYEQDTGRIKHVHTVTVFEGGRNITEKEAIEAARTHASKVGHNLNHLKIKTSKDPKHGQSPHCIDLQTLNFVPITQRLSAQRRDKPPMT